MSGERKDEEYYLVDEPLVDVEKLVRCEREPNIAISDAGEHVCADCHQVLCISCGRHNDTVWRSRCSGCARGFLKGSC